MSKKKKLFLVRRLVETTQLSFKVVENENKIVGFAAFDLEPDFESKNIKNELYTPQSVLELMLFMAEDNHQNVDAIVSCILSAVFKRKGFKKSNKKSFRDSLTIIRWTELFGRLPNYCQEKGRIIRYSTELFGSVPYRIIRSTELLSTPADFYRAT